MLPEPPVVTQEPERCWAAAFVSWSRAMSDHYGIAESSFAGSEEQLIALFRRLDDRLEEQARRVGRRLGPTSRFLQRGTDRATLHPGPGMRTMFTLGLMQMRMRLSRTLRPQIIRDLLDSGYVYLAYYRSRGRGRPLSGHALVVYGINGDWIYFMDPAPGQGLMHIRLHDLMRASVLVVTGVSVLTGLQRALDQSLATLRPQATPQVRDLF